ncbi:MAG TPA: FBP domain-containing protein [Ktedonobacteraceae bacterium]|nr:FBP domain-containing protein [Ktedonobacteraceae bacterium]
MKSLDRDQFAQLLKQARVKPRLMRELRFVPEEITDWEDRELLAVTTRSGNEGVLLIQLDELYVLPYQFSGRIADSQTGRSKAITCDFCYTWQRGSNAGTITFDGQEGHSFSFLCCGDLDCSLHVRNKTAAATLSRSQLHEDLTAEQRIERLRERLGKVLLTVIHQ